MGCEVIADKQQELADGGESTNGMKIALVPVAVQAALDAMREIKKKHHHSDDE